MPEDRPKKNRVPSLCADAHSVSTDGGLMQHMVQKHGCQVLLADSVGQLCWLNRQGGALCGTDRSGVANATAAKATLLSANFGWETLSRTDDSPGIRTLPPAVRQPVNNSLRARSQFLQENLWMTARCRTALLGDAVLTERDKQLLTELRRASAMALPRCVAWAESLEGAMSGRRS